MTAPGWRVPKPLDTVEVEAAGGARIILRRHGRVDGPRLVLSHDNGVAIDLYYPFWSRLASRFELIVYDLRSHGRNPTADLAGHSVATFTADDARIRAGIERHFGAKPAAGVFHSLSAMITLNQDPPGSGYAGLVLFDPPMYLPDGDHYGIGCSSSPGRGWKTSRRTPCSGPRRTGTGTNSAVRASSRRRCSTLW